MIEKQYQFKENMLVVSVQLGQKENNYEISQPKERDCWKICIEV